MTGARLLALGRRLRPMHAADWVLVALIVAGVALRVLATFSWWPATTTLADSWPYSLYAASNALHDPQHPAGYPWLLAALGGISHEVAFTIIVQHLLGIVSAVVFYATVIRITGSRWTALVPAAVVLLNGDQILLEHSIMSEGPFVFLLAWALYAAVRAVDDPDPWWRWPLACGLLIISATLVRSAALFLVPVVVVALFAAAPRPWRPRWRAPATVAATVAVLLVAYAFANDSATGRFEIGPTQGWHLYGRVAPFADCNQFEPPAGTEELCDSTPVAERPGGDFYLYDPESPAIRAFGEFGADDDRLGAFARQVVLHQPRAYVNAMWTDLKAYYAPSSRPLIVGSGGDLEPQLAWESALGPHDRFATENMRDVEAGMERFFNDFTVDVDAAGIHVLDDLQDVLRFGATALSISTLLCLLGLLYGRRRDRVGVLLFGVGGLALLIAPTLSVYYVGRYTVPLAAPLAAGAAIAAHSIWALERARRASRRSADPAPAAAPPA